MPLQNKDRPVYFPMGRGKCRTCGSAKYRSGLCRDHFYEKKRSDYKPKSIQKTCGDCKKPFISTRGIQKYCSYRCSLTARNKREAKGPKISTISGSQYKLRLTNNLIDAVCEQCSKEFSYKRMSSERKARFCSSPCFYLSNSGASSVLTREGVFHCPPTRIWNELRALIRDMDKGCCAACHNPPRRKGDVPVDHIIPRRLMHQWGVDPHQLFNLVSMCRSCHAKKTFVENCILKGDFVGFISGLASINYPMGRVRECFSQLGLPMRMLQEVA